MASSWPSSITFLLALAACGSSHAAEVRVYRCTGADGRTALQDAPCSKDQAQELRTLARPPEAAPLPAPPAAPAEAPVAGAPPPEAIPVEPAPPAPPLYECITHDGKRYTNTTGVGETRWVPLWVLGMEPKAPAKTFQRTGATPAPPRSTPRAPASAPGPEGLGAGAWVRDTCYELPPSLVCERRGERLSELRRLRRLAQASARVPLDAEYETLSAQQAAECR